MPRIWIDAAAVLLAATLLGGCATSKEKLLPHGDSTMLDIWHRETGGSAGGCAPSRWTGSVSQPGATSVTTANLRTRSSCSTRPRPPNWPTA